MRRRGFLGALSLGFWPFGFVRASDESTLDGTSNALLGLDSKDLATFRESCGIISNRHASYDRRLAIFSYVLQAGFENERLKERR
jgi:hypothetical protein